MKKKIRKSIKYRNVSRVISKYHEQDVDMPEEREKDLKTLKEFLKKSDNGENIDKRGHLKVNKILAKFPSIIDTFFFKPKTQSVMTKIEKGAEWDDYAHTSDDF